MLLKKYTCDVAKMIMQCRYQLANANIHVFPHGRKVTVGQVYTIVKYKGYLNAGPPIELDNITKQIEVRLQSIKEMDEKAYNALLEMDTSELLFPNELS